MKSGCPDWWHGQTLYCSRLIHLPWQLCAANEVHRVIFPSTPCPWHLYPKCFLMAASWHWTQTLEPCCRLRPTSGPNVSQALRDFTISNTTQYLQIRLKVILSESFTNLKISLSLKQFNEFVNIAICEKFFNLLRFNFYALFWLIMSNIVHRLKAQLNEFLEPQAQAQRFRA
jgi:hypothetical protein